MPFTKYTPSKYYPMVWIREALEEEGIPYKIICNNDGKKNKSYNEEGIILSTIDSVLGLDFKE